jgi:DNA modification methylase
MQLGTYQLGPNDTPENGIYTGDAMALAEAIPDESVDLVVTSPPYDGLRDYNGYAWDFRGIANQLIRALKPGGVIVWIVGDQTVDGDETGSSFRQALYFKSHGLKLWDTMIYHTDKPPMTHRRYQACFEYMFVLSKGAPTTFNPLMDRARNAGSERRGITYRKDSSTKLSPQSKGGRVSESVIREAIWRIPSGHAKSTIDAGVMQLHPATFPERLAYDHVYTWSNAGDIVLDPFMGSGTVAKVSKLQGRYCLGFEISDEYARFARERVRNTQPPLFVPEPEQLVFGVND